MLILGYNEITKNLRSVIVDVDTPEEENFVRGNPLDANTLLRAGIKKENKVIVALEKDEDSIFAVLLCKHLNPEVKVFVIVKKRESVEKAYNAGANNVILESEILSREILRFLLTPKVASFMDRLILSEDLEILALKPPLEYIGKKIKETDIRRKIGTIIAVKREGKIITNPPPDFLLTERDILFFFCERKEINKMREMLARWIYQRS